MKAKCKGSRLHNRGAGLRKDLGAWVLMLPSLVLFAFFIWVPLMNTIQMSFYKVKGVTLQEFVGFQNYVKVFKHPVFDIAWSNTIKYTLCSLVVGLAVPVVIAALIAETTHFKGFFRVSTYFPNIIPGIAAMFILTYFFRADETGVLNIIMAKLGIGPFKWLTNARLTILWIVVAMTWKAAGSTALVYAASISGISPDLYEASTIDGATPLRRFFSITMPTILKTGKTMLIMQIIAVFQILYEPMIMTNGGPNNASISIMQLVYRFAFEDMKMANAAALSVMVCIALIILTAIYFWVASKADSD